MTRIAVIDGWRKFMPPVTKYWRSQGHEVFTSINWGRKYTWDLGVEVTFFYAIENNLRVASRKDEKPPGTRVVAEAVDIDIYTGSFGGIRWEYLDALIFMARHTKDIGLKKAGKKMPKDLPIYVVPGGVDLNTWTYRRESSRGYNVAWIGRKWIAKNVFGAIQIFNQLVKTDPDNPWKLFLRADPAHFKQAWWGNHIHAYLEANDRLRGRVEWVPWQEDLNEWLEDKSFLIQTSFKEAFSYVSCQAAAKGIKVIMQMTNGMNHVWPSNWIFQTHDEAVRMFLENYQPEDYRAYISDQYPLENRLRALDEICFR